MASRRSKNGVLYDDGAILCSADGITIRNYYFPSMRTKRLSWAEIEGVECRPLSLFSGRLRLWGMGIKPCWFNLDWRRPLKTCAIEINTGSLLRTAITPRDHEKVLAIIGQRVGQRTKSTKKSAKQTKRKS